MVCTYKRHGAHSTRAVSPIHNHCGKESWRLLHLPVFHGKRGAATGADVSPLRSAPPEARINSGSWHSARLAGTSTHKPQPIQIARKNVRFGNRIHAFLVLAKKRHSTAIERFWDLETRVLQPIFRPPLPRGGVAVSLCRGGGRRHERCDVIPFQRCRNARQKRAPFGSLIY